MKLLRNSAAVLVAGLALAAMPSIAEAHGGSHPFKNCTEAYQAGYANIPRGDEHYGDHLDRDQDGVGCDKPPSDFVPAKPGDGPAGDAAPEQVSDEKEPSGTGAKAPEATDGENLAETGGNASTPYLVTGGAAVLLAGGGLVVMTRKRRATR